MIPVLLEQWRQRAAAWDRVAAQPGDRGDVLDDARDFARGAAEEARRCAREIETALGLPSGDEPSVPR